VEFPPERSEWRRKAYGRNGVGLHGLLCFSDHYEVETWREGKGAGFEIGTQSSATPIKINKETSFLRAGHGDAVVGGWSSAICRTLMESAKSFRPGSYTTRSSSSGSMGSPSRWPTSLA
jgi:hypothetical protein